QENSGKPASKPAIKYLGVMIDNRLSFRAHTKYPSAKAAKTQASLSHMLPNIDGPRAGIRRLLARVVTSVLLYAAPVWAWALDRSQEIRRKVAAPYRLAAIRVISGFRTVSEDAALVLAEMIPIDLLAREMVELYRWRLERGRIPPEDGNMAGKMGRI
ncbi:hypothetical protein ACLKA7_000079, partial [Drosophila subpalustris]